MRMHVVGFPHTQVTVDYSWCAYTQKVRRFCNMMMSLGHEVFLYAGVETDAQCTEHIVVTHNETRSDVQSFPPTWTSSDPFWKDMNDAAVIEINTRIDSLQNNYLCIIAGRSQWDIAARLPQLMPVEYGVGYEGTVSDFRVFESYAWMHTVYGYQQGAMNANGHFFDTVIPNSYDDDEFELGTGDGKYLLYMGRLTARKGIQIALDTARAAHIPLVIAGEGEFELPDWVDYRGLVNAKERVELYGSALATIVPTMYVEPFGGVAVESMLCGTPVITTDFGAFTETVDYGITGFRCSMLKEFRRAVALVSQLNREYIRSKAMSRYSTEQVKHQYDRYFDQLETLKGKGWYTLD